MIDLLERLRDPFNVNLLAQVAAVAALDDTAHVARSRQVNREGRLFLERALQALGLAFVRSHGNFMLVEVGDGAHAYEALLRSGVIVRPMGGYGLPRHLRVSIGLADENTRLVQALAALYGYSGTAVGTLQQGNAGAPLPGVGR